MDKVEVLIINYMKEGLTQVEISEKFRMDDIKPNSLSSIEKRLSKLKEIYEAKTLFHLACILHKEKFL